MRPESRAPPDSVGYPNIPVTCPRDSHKIEHDFGLFAPNLDVGIAIGICSSLIGVRVFRRFSTGRRVQGDLLDKNSRYGMADWGREQDGRASGSAGAGPQDKCG